MRLKTFRNNILLNPLQTIILDRPFELNGDKMYVLALTYEDNSYSLWVMDCLSSAVDEPDRIIDPLNETNRNRLKRIDTSGVRSIESIEIGESIFKFNGSVTETFEHTGSQSLHHLQYFIDKGVELHQWDNVHLEKMRLTRHKNSESHPMSDIKLDDEAIKLNFGYYHKDVEVSYKYSVNFNLDTPVKFKYFNPFEKIDEYFYVHKFEIYDFEKHIDAIDNEEKFKNLPKEHLDRMKSSIIKYAEVLKSNNSSLVLMTYEAERGLPFQSTELLDRSVEKGTHGSSIGFIFRPEEEFGIHGKKLFIASFQDVPNNQLEEIEFELLSVSKIVEACSVNI